MTERRKFNREGYLNENFRIFHLRDTAGQELDYHYHEFDKLVVLISGGVIYTVEGESYRLEPYDVLLVRHHMIHRAEIDLSAPYERIIIYIDSSYVNRFAPDSGLTDCFAEAEKSHSCLLCPSGEEIPALKDALGRLETAGRDEKFGAELLRGTMLVQLLVLVNRMMQGGAGRGATRTVSGGKIAPALSYINENLTKSLGIDEMAAMCYISRYHFMRMFKAQTGSTVHSYIRQKRLMLAARLIREGMNASVAAEECGFADYSSFHRAFKQTFHISPGQMKKL